MSIWDAATTLVVPYCPRCLGFIPTNETPGEYQGAWSRQFQAVEEERGGQMTMVCSPCGREEAMLFGRQEYTEEWPVASNRARVRLEHGKGKTNARS